MSEAQPSYLTRVDENWVDDSPLRIRTHGLFVYELFILERRGSFRMIRKTDR